MRPSHAAATPIEARNAGMRVVAISWDQSENRLASPMPSTVQFNQRMSTWLFFRSGVDEGAFIPCEGLLQKLPKQTPSGRVLVSWKRSSYDPGHNIGDASRKKQVASRKPGISSTLRSHRAELADACHLGQGRIA
jgi:hypothetical protein